MEELSIRVTIAGRIYPLTIKRTEEENIRKAATLVNDKIKEYEENYSVRDKQDLLAMCGLQFAAKNLELDGKTLNEDKELAESLSEIESIVSDYLKKEKQYVL